MRNVFYIVEEALTKIVFTYFLFHKKWDKFKQLLKNSIQKEFILFSSGSLNTCKRRQNKFQKLM